METIKFKERMMRCQTPCPHGMTYASVPIKPNLQGVHYELVRKGKNGAIAVGSWCCESCMFHEKTNHDEKTVICGYEDRKQQLSLFK